MGKTTPTPTPEYDYFVGNMNEYFVLSSYISANNDHAALCVEQFGPNAVVVDWDRDIKFSGTKRVTTLMRQLGIKRTINTNFYFVTRDGQKTVYTHGRSR